MRSIINYAERGIFDVRVVDDVPALYCTSTVLFDWEETE